MSKINKTNANKENKWVFVPNEHDSTVTCPEFRNKYIVADAVLQLIGEKEAQKIDDKIKEMLHWRELMYGKHSKRVDYKTPILHFVNEDFPNITIECGAGGRMNVSNKHLFTKNADKARLEDYTIEITTLVNYQIAEK